MSQPTLRLQQRRDGTWNLQGLLADPWPVPLGGEPAADHHQEWHGRAGRRRGTVFGAQANAGIHNDRRARPGRPRGPRRSSATCRSRSRETEARASSSSTARPGATSSTGCRIQGTIDVNTGRITLGGDLTGLTLSETLRRRIPPAAQPAVKAMALNGGVVDLELTRFCFDPSAAADRRLRYQAQARIREGVWECPKLPFPLNDLSALVSVEDGVMTIKYAQGSNGRTSVHADGSLALCDPRAGTAGSARQTDRPGARPAAPRANAARARRALGRLQAPGDESTPGCTWSATRWASRST